MAENNLRNLRRLAKKYNIRFRLASEPFPDCHVDTFKNIEELGSYRFETYAENASIRSAEEPWARQTKSRAEWLAHRAAGLFKQNRNEAGWRFGLENDVLRRARIWKSEIQATIKNNEHYSKRLEERQNSRKPCECSYGKHLYDFYETGTNNLFEDRAEAFILYEGILQSELKKQGPDRVYGLKNTSNLDSLLSSLAPPELANEPGDTVADVIKHTPFSSDVEPLLFPFLVLEAKSESSNSGFDAIQIQSAFPIRALLKLQEDLQSSSPISDPAMAPLVWFLACRGDAWRVYGAYLASGQNESPTSYALQLVLIVDYIMDWARDIYRLEILRHLKSIVTGQISDQMSFRDSDIFSTCGSVFNWIPPPRSVATPRSIATEDIAESSFTANWDQFESSLPTHEAMLNAPIPNTELGSLRSAFISNFRFVCLYITSDLVPSLLELIGGKSGTKANIESVARRLINFVTQFDEVLVMSGRDLDLLEMLWTGVSHSSTEASPEEFFVIMEASWYFSTSWDIKREISCLAISRTAFEVLKKIANFRVKHKGIDKLARSERICHEKAIRDLVDCLTSASSWQVLLAAVSCTLVTIYPFPLRKRHDFAPALEALGFGYIREARVQPFIQQILCRKMWVPKKRVTVTRREMRAALQSGMTAEEVFASKRDRNPRHTDMSFKRISECQKNIVKVEGHLHEHCARCILSLERHKSQFGHGFLDRRNPPVISAYKTVILVSLENNNPASFIACADICVFGLGELDCARDNHSIASMIEEMTLPKSLIFHTIKSNPEHFQCYPDEIKCNLPLPYRSISVKERLRITDWVLELRGHVRASSQDMDMDILSSEWKQNQSFLFLLSIGHSEYEASLMLEHKPWGNYQNTSDLARIIARQNGIKETPYFPSTQLRRTSKIAGDELVIHFGSWEEGTRYLWRQYPRQIEHIASVNTAEERKHAVEDSDSEVEQELYESS
ncbi:unnamed protein product [Penicillium glandicola]